MNKLPDSPDAERAEESGVAYGGTGSRIPSLAALGAVFALPVSLDAGIVYSGLQNLSVTLPVGERPASEMVVGSANRILPLDLDGDSVPDFGFYLIQGFDTAPVTKRLGAAVGLGVGWAVTRSTTSALPVMKLFNPGSLIGTGSTSVESAGFPRWVSEGTTRYALGMSPGVSGFVGFSFDLSGSTHFGWLRLMIEDGPEGFPISITAYDWAWNDEDFAPIAAGQVPEVNPALALLAAAGTGLVAWRGTRRRRTPEHAN